MLEIKRSSTKEFALEIKEGDVIITSPWLPEKENIDLIRILGVLHLVSAEKRIEILEWAYKSLGPTGQLLLQVPAWYHGRSYCDPGVVWPPISAEFFMLMNKEFRTANMPHVVMECDFHVNAAFSYDGNDVFVAFRNAETQATLLARNVNTCTDFVLTCTKKV